MRITVIFSASKHTFYNYRLFIGIISTLITLRLLLTVYKSINISFLAEFEQASIALLIKLENMATVSIPSIKSSFGLVEVMFSLIPFSSHSFFLRISNILRILLSLYFSIFESSHSFSIFPTYSCAFEYLPKLKFSKHLDVL